MSEIQHTLNPRIPDVTIGIRNPRNIKIYPLSLAAEFQLKDILNDALQAYMGRDAKRKLENDSEFINAMIDLVKKSLVEILKLVADDISDDILNEITNDQATEIANVLFEQNFEQSVKNVKGLLEKIANLSASKRPLPQSANDTEPTT